MAKPNKIPDFRKIYPEANEEVISELRKSERKMQYEEFDLKAERVVKDKTTNTITFLPAREDSIERLKDQVYSIADDALGTEEQAIRNVCYRQLYQALSGLPKEEKYLIEQLYFVDRSEREMAKEMKIFHNAVHKQKYQILAKLKKILENL